jgi:hypothetical protein
MTLDGNKGILDIVEEKKKSKLEEAAMKLPKMNQKEQRTLYQQSLKER